MISTWVIVAIVSLVLFILSLLGFILCLVFLIKRKREKKPFQLLGFGLLIFTTLFIGSLLVGIDTGRAMITGMYTVENEDGMHETFYEEYVESDFQKEKIATSQQAYIESPPDLDMIYEDIFNSKLHPYKLKGEVKKIKGYPGGINVEAIQIDEDSEHKTFYVQIPEGFLAGEHIQALNEGDKFILCFYYYSDAVNLDPIVLRKI